MLCAWWNRGVLCLATRFQLVDVEGEFEGRTKFQAHVLHHHVTTQQKESLPVNLLKQANGNRETRNQDIQTTVMYMHT